MQTLKEYEVEVTQTLRVIISIDATSPSEARKKAMEMESVGEITKVKVLGARPIK